MNVRIDRRGFLQAGAVGLSKTTLQVPQFNSEGAWLAPPLFIESQDLWLLGRERPDSQPDHDYPLTSGAVHLIPANQPIIERNRPIPVTLVGHNLGDGELIASASLASLDGAIWLVKIDDRVVFAKVAGDTGFVGRMKRWAFGHSPSLASRSLVGLATSVEREWHALREAEKRDVRAIRCLAAGVRYVSPTAQAIQRPLQTVLLSEGLTDTVSLTDAWEQSVTRSASHLLRNGEHESPNGSCPPEQAPGAARRVGSMSLIKAVARLFALTHQRGFVHGDAHPNNILVQSSSTGEPEAIYVDVHSALLGRGPASARRSLSSLAQLS